MNAHINSVSIASSSSSPLDLAIPFELQMIETTTSLDSNRRRPRKKRSRIEKDSTVTTAAVSSKAKYSKKPDPNAPKITPPCTECGKRFWSDKALFGHMRCHPERQWRGINPPLNFRRSISVSPFSPNIATDLEDSSFTEEDQDIANCLLMLANSPNSISRVSDCRFECSSCKKVFGSHQALGGHRASHKNVRGCFAIAKSDEETEDEITLFGHDRSINLENRMSMMILGTAEHKCSGHKRFHWENNAAAEEGFVNLDLNMPAPLEDGSSSSYSSSLTLDLRLGL